jgi:hypothetical protein
MDVTQIAGLATSMAETGNRQEVGLAVLKRAQDIGKDHAMQLIESVKASSPPNLPPHLGNHINTTA